MVNVVIISVLDMRTAVIVEEENGSHKNSG